MIEERGGGGVNLEGERCIWRSDPTVGHPAWTLLGGCLYSVES